MLRCWSFWHDLSQLKRTYPDDWQSLVNNCSVQQYFGVSAPQAAFEIESYLGGAVPRPLTQLKRDEALLIQHGERPRIVTRPNYLRDAEFVGAFSPNPFYTPSHNEVGSVVATTDSVVVPFPERDLR